MAMEFRVLDENFNVYDVIDNYESAIWTIRFSEAGDFEIYTPVTTQLLDSMRIGWYLFSDKFYDSVTDTAHLMIIETIEIESDPENGNKIKITGRDLDSLLTRRIVWGQKNFATGTNVATIVQTILNENVINPSDWSRTYQAGDGGTVTVSVSGADRKIDNFVLKPITGTFKNITGDLQLDGNEIYEVLNELCQNYKFGYEVLYNFTTGKFEFELKNYRDCTYQQTDNPAILFSPAFENIKNSNYLESSSNEKNSALIGGEGDEFNIMYQVYGSGKGLDRREVFISGSDVNQKDDSTGGMVSNRTYLNMLLEKGKTEMLNYIYTQTYEGTAETSRGYNYPDDFTIGDVVEIINEWGISAEVLVSEVVLSNSTSGYSIIPTFAAIEKGGE